MKKIGFIVMVILSIMLMCSAAVGAETITVEGEKFTKTDVPVGYASDDNLSGGRLVQIYSVLGGGEKAITYEFDVPAAGTYRMVSVSSEFNVSWTSDYSVVVNGEEIDVKNNAVLLGKAKSSAGSNTLREFDLGSVSLKEGRNIVQYVINTSDVNSSNQTIFFLDCFRLEEAVFSLNSIEPTEACGIFQKSRDVQFRFNFGAASPADVKYDFKVTDFWGADVAKGTLECAENVMESVLNLGKFETGWYIFEAYYAGTDQTIKRMYFSVVPDLSERTLTDTPFATDFANELVRSNKRISQLADAVKLAGITWVRARYSWAEIERAKGSYNFDNPDFVFNTFADRGINILAMTHSLPEWTSEKDLDSLYKIQKTMASRYAGKVQTWELLNEYDGNFGYIPGDMFSAYQKTAAIAIKDSKSNAQTTFGGHCIDPNELLFTELTMKNKIMDYSDIYNIHCHIDGKNLRYQQYRSKFEKNHRELKLRESEEAKPLWVTEAGMSLQRASNGVPTLDWLRSQARYNVTSTIESLAAGTDKHFWFVWPAYVENGREWGVFTENYDPNPVYASQSIMTYALGEAKVKGKLDREDINGWLFDSGKNDVLAVWTTFPRAITLKSENPVKVMDIMGRSKTVMPVDGSIKVEVSYYPEYIIFDEPLSQEEYYPLHYEIDDGVRCEYTDAQRVVLSQEYEGEDLKVAKGGGYPITPGEDRELTLKLTNFNNREMSGKISGALDGFDVVIDNPDVTIPAMSQVSVPVRLKQVNQSICGTVYLRLSATFEGQETSPSVAALNIPDNRPVDVKGMFDWNNASNWSLTNVMAGVKPSMSTENGEAQFTYIHNRPSEVWVYPHMGVQDASVLKDTDGIVFWVKYDEKNTSKGNNNVFLYLKDGREYYLGAYPNINISNEWTCVKRYWKDFVLDKTPLGAADIRDFDQTLIQDISIGGNYVGTSTTYSIKDFGYFVDPNKESDQSAEFVNVKDGEIYKGNQLTDVEIKLPEGAGSRKVSVMMQDDFVKTYTVEGDTIHADLSGFGKGTYILRVITEDKDGFKKSHTVNLLIQ